MTNFKEALKDPAFDFLNVCSYFMRNPFFAIFKTIKNLASINCLYVCKNIRSDS